MHTHLPSSPSSTLRSAQPLSPRSSAFRPVRSERISRSEASSETPKYLASSVAVPGRSAEKEVARFSTGWYWGI